MAAVTDASGCAALVPIADSTEVRASTEVEAEMLNTMNSMMHLMMVGQMLDGSNSLGGLGDVSPLAGMDPAAIAALGVDPTTLAALTAASAAGAQGAGTLVGGPVGDGKPGDWICAYCETLNFCVSKNCHKCGADNEHAKRIGMKPGDWICPTCSDLVFATRQHCKRCNTQRPPDAADGLV